MNISENANYNPAYASRHKGDDAEGIYLEVDTTHASYNDDHELATVKLTHDEGINLLAQLKAALQLEDATATLLAAAKAIEFKAPIGDLSEKSLYTITLTMADIQALREAIAKAEGRAE